MHGSIFLREIGKRLTTISGDPRETSFLLQRISVTLQRYNAVAFRGSFQEVSGLRLRSQRKCGFIGLYFVDLQGSFVPGAKKLFIIIIIIIIIITA